MSKSKEEEKPLGFIQPLSSAIDIDTMMEDIDEVIEEIRKIKLGICAMNKKTKSQPMQEILSRISRFDFVEIIIFPDDVIMNEPVENWPICDALISFYSAGFPLSKAINYAELRKPFVLNDLQMQFTLKDRCVVYNLLESINIEIPRYAILMRDENGIPIDTDFIEREDSIKIGNEVFQKPFVEKPIDAEDHNVFIYFPSFAGGGSQRLFRKVGSRSSIYSAESSVRKYGSYIYEDFVHTDGTDVKIYTIGPEYAHAEARKSPSLDGKVERDSQGKEIRYPVILNHYEKEIAHKVCKLFKQTVCGFDLLRTHGKSYVCDVNGFSFVKTSKKYYDDCAQVLVNIILQQLAPQFYKPYEIEADSEDPMIDTVEGNVLELRCVVGIIRHGDRTPKQKLKMEVRHPEFIELFNKYSESTKKKLKLKQPNQLQEVLDIARSLLEDMDQGQTMFEKSHKLHQLKNVLEMYGHFSGINRKIQFKYLGHVRDNNVDTNSSEDSQAEKPAKTKEKDEEALLLIMKWGGELTQAGRVQAEDLGRAFRSLYTIGAQQSKHEPCMYPGGEGAYSAIPGCGLLRLHSTYRHDLKIYASDEGRVQMTAGAFAKGFLALEGELTPILVHLVRSDKNTTEMLDTSDQATKFMAKVKHQLHDLMQIDRDFTEEDFHKLAPTQAESLVSAMKKVKNPRHMCAKLSGLVHALTLQLKELMNSNTYNPRDPFLYHDETLELMTHRWNKLDKDFKLKNGMYDISIIPDIYDSIKYDIQHNRVLNLQNTQELYNCVKALADIVIPQEYGLSADQKTKISKTICQRLIRKIQGDLTHADVTDTFTRLNPKYSQSVISPHRHVRTRLYFTSESHVHSVINVLRYGGLIEDETLDFQWKRALHFLCEVPELNYMTQIILMLYEDPSGPADKRFHIEIHFSPGAKTLDQTSITQQRGKSAEPKKSRPVTLSPTSIGNLLEREHEETKSPKENHGAESTRPTGTVTEEQHATGTTPKTPGDKTPQEEVQETVDGRKSSASLPRDIPHNSKDKILDNSYEATEVDNESSRCAIGMGDFTDSTGSPVQEAEQQENVPEKRRRSKSGIETVLFAETRNHVSRTKSESDVEVPAYLVVDHSRRRSYQSDDSMFVEISESPPVGQSSGDRLDESDFEKTEVSQDNQPHSLLERPPMNRSRSVSTSCLPESCTTRTERCASDPLEETETIVTQCSQSTEALDLQYTIGNTMPTTVKSDSMVLDSRYSPSFSSRPSSSPTTKKTRKNRFSTACRNSAMDGSGIQDRPGTLFYLPAIRKVTKQLSMQVHGTYRIRTPITLSDSRRPPIAEFYDEAISPVTSIHRLLTLHNATPLPTMDKFLTRMIEENSESDVTPATTPTRKGSKPKKLPSTAQQQSQDNHRTRKESVVCLEGLLDITELKRSLPKDSSYKKRR